MPLSDRQGTGSGAIVALQRARHDGQRLKVEVNDTPRHMSNPAQRTHLGYLCVKNLLNASTSTAEHEDAPSRVLTTVSTTASRAWKRMP